MTNLNNNIELNPIEELHQCNCCGEKEKECTTIVFGASRQFGSFIAICNECKNELHYKLKVDATTDRVADTLVNMIFGGLENKEKEPITKAKIEEDFKMTLSKIAKEFKETYTVDALDPKMIIPDSFTPESVRETMRILESKVKPKTTNEKLDELFELFGDYIDTTMLHPRDTKMFETYLNTIGVELKPVERSGEEAVIKDTKEENVNFELEDISDEVAKDIITKNFMADLSVDGEIPNPTQIYPNPELLFITPEEEDECDCNVCKVMKSKMYSASHREHLRNEVEKVVSEKNNNGTQLNMTEVLLEATDNILKQTFTKKAYESINRTSELISKLNTVSEEEPECDCEACSNDYRLEDLSDETRESLMMEMASVIKQREANGGDINDIIGIMNEASRNLIVRNLDKEVIEYLEETKKKPAYKNLNNYIEKEKPKKEDIGASNKIYQADMMFPTFLVHPSPNTNAIISFKVLKNRKEGK